MLVLFVFLAYVFMFCLFYVIGLRSTYAGSIFVLDECIRNNANTYTKQKRRNKKGDYVGNMPGT